MTNLNYDPIVRLPEVERIAGIKRSCIANLEKQGKFPKRVALGPRSVGWRLSEINEWCESRLPKEC